MHLDHVIPNDELAANAGGSNEAISVRHAQTPPEKYQQNVSANIMLGTLNLSIRSMGAALFSWSSVVILISYFGPTIPVGFFR